MNNVNDIMVIDYGLSKRFKDLEGNLLPNR